MDYASRAIEHLPESLWILYQQSLALARGRSIRRARHLTEDLLERLQKRKKPDRALQVEALSLAGRLFKDTGRTARRPADQKRYFHAAQQRYSGAYELDRGFFPAINAATMAMLAGDAPLAEQLAREVIREASGGLDQDGNTDDYWLLATLGEAELICQNFDGAIGLYGRAVELARNRIGDIASMRRNVELLARCLPMPEALTELFTFGNVVVFAGHMIDHPDRTARHKLPARFPPIRALEERLSTAIADQIDTINPVIGYCSIANGSDVLFAEQDAPARAGVAYRVAVRSRRLHAYERDVRHPADDRMARSGDGGAGQGPGSLRHAANGSLMTTCCTSSPTASCRGWRFFAPRSSASSPRHCSRSRPTALPGGSAGTAAFHKLWARQGRAMSVIDVGELRRSLPASAKPRKMGQPKAPPPVEGASLGKRRIAYMLFSDVQNFSKLKEEHTPAFLSQFMRIVRDVLRRSQAQPSFANTWGDALYLVFDSPVACADFATRLLRRMDKVDWARHHLPADTAMRIGLHAGPVYRRHNAILDRQDVFGSHVNLAARIEPVTTPGSAWVSEHFAAELALAPDHNFACDYVGIQELPKRFGKAPLYRLVQR